MIGFLVVKIMILLNSAYFELMLYTMRLVQNHVLLILCPQQPRRILEKGPMLIQSFLRKLEQKNEEGGGIFAPSMP